MAEECHKQSQKAIDKTGRKDLQHKNTYSR
jgi:hypothetical protein